jgi:hypothetical protein
MGELNNVVKYEVGLSSRGRRGRSFFGSKYNPRCALRAALCTLQLASLTPFFASLRSSNLQASPSSFCDALYTFLQQLSNYI